MSVEHSFSLYSASCDTAKRRVIEHVRVVGRSQLPRTTYGQWRWMGRLVGRALDDMSVYDRLGCDVIGLQEIGCSRHSVFSLAGYFVYCSRECGDENGEKGQGRVGLAVRISITRAVSPPEFISDRLLKVTLERRGRGKAIALFVAYAPTETQNASNKHVFWTILDRAVEEVPRHEQMFVLMDANARTERMEKGEVESKDNKIIGLYGRKTLNDNGEPHESLANNHDLAIVSTFFSTSKGGVSHTFNGRGKNVSTTS